MWFWNVWLDLNPQFAFVYRQELEKLKHELLRDTKPSIGSKESSRVSGQTYDEIVDQSLMNCDLTFSLKTENKILNLWSSFLFWYSQTSSWFDFCLLRFSQSWSWRNFLRSSLWLPKCFLLFLFALSIKLLHHNKANCFCVLYVISKNVHKVVNSKKSRSILIFLFLFSFIFGLFVSLFVHFY